MNRSHETPAPNYTNRFAANKSSKTDPEVATTATILSRLRTAMESTGIGPPAATGAAFFMRPPLEPDRAFAAILIPVWRAGR